MKSYPSDTLFFLTFTLLPRAKAERTSTDYKDYQNRRTKKNVSYSQKSGENAA